MRRAKWWNLELTGYLGSMVDELRCLRGMSSATRCRLYFAESGLKERIRDTFSLECCPPDWLIESRIKACPQQGQNNLDTEN